MDGSGSLSPGAHVRVRNADLLPRQSFNMLYTTGWVCGIFAWELHSHQMRYGNLSAALKQWNDQPIFSAPIPPLKRTCTTGRREGKKKKKKARQGLLESPRQAIQMMSAKYHVMLMSPIFLLLPDCTALAHSIEQMPGGGGCSHLHVKFFWN